MAGQPSAPEDHAATLLQAEPRSHDTVFMVRVQRRFRSWGLMVRSAERASGGRCYASPREPCRPGSRTSAFILRDARDARCSG